jgi:hypothetical protein
VPVLRSPDLARAAGPGTRAGAATTQGALMSHCVNDLGASTDHWSASALCPGAMIGPRRDVGADHGRTHAGLVAPGTRRSPARPHDTGRGPVGSGHAPVSPHTGVGGVDLIVDRRSGRTRWRAWPRRALSGVQQPPREGRRPQEPGRGPAGHEWARRASSRSAARGGATQRSDATGHARADTGLGIRWPAAMAGVRSAGPGMRGPVVPALLMPVERAARWDDDASFAETREIIGVSPRRLWCGRPRRDKLSAPRKYHSQWP